MSETSIGNPSARRREAGVFLRSRRGRLTPAEVGLPQGLRRRTPGLRREEVAMLAGVGTTWYSWLEQGRQIQPSHEVLTALARVLRLDPAERRHLFSLYDRSMSEPRAADDERVDAPLRRMLDGLGGQPALVLGWRWDVLASNRAADLLLGTQDSVGGDRPNVLEGMFLNPAQRHLFVDWETVARGALPTFRADCAAHVGDPELDALVARLTDLSPEFAAWWPRRDVAHRLAGVKRLDHPVAGRLNLAFSMLAVGDRPGLKLLVFTAVDEEDTPRKLSRILAPEVV